MQQILLISILVITIITLGLLLLNLKRDERYTPGEEKEREEKIPLKSEPIFDLTKITKLDDPLIFNAFKDFLSIRDLNELYFTGSRGRAMVDKLLSSLFKKTGYKLSDLQRLRVFYSASQKMILGQMLPRECKEFMKILYQILTILGAYFVRSNESSYFMEDKECNYFVLTDISNLPISYFYIEQPVGINDFKIFFSLISKNEPIYNGIIIYIPKNDPKYIEIDEGLFKLYGSLSHDPISRSYSLLEDIGNMKKYTFMFPFEEMIDTSQIRNFNLMASEWISSEEILAPKTLPSLDLVQEFVNLIRDDSIPSSEKLRIFDIEKVSENRRLFEALFKYLNNENQEVVNYGIDSIRQLSHIFDRSTLTGLIEFLRSLPRNRSSRMM